MSMLPIVPLGDTAALVQLPDEAAASRFAAAARAGDVAGRFDVVQAYVSVAIFFDAHVLPFARAATWLRGLDVKSVPAAAAGRSFVIPCCYDFGPDLERVAEHTKLAAADVIARHSAAEYTVYAVGFCPGFPYLGYLPDELAGVPRLPAPRPRVEPGSVGLTGRQ